jgi:phage-related protein
MNDIEYILRIILKARDEMAGVLAKARTQLRGFAKDADAMNTSVTNLNQAMKNFDNHMDGVTKKLQAWRTVLHDAADGGKEVVKSVDNIGKAQERAVTRTKAAIKTNEDYFKSIEDLGKTFTKLNDDFGKGTVSRNDYVADLQRIGKEYDKLSSKADIGSELSRALRKGGDEARKSADGIVKANKDVTDTIEQAIRAEEDHQKALHEKAVAQDNLVKSANKLRDEYREIQKTEKRTDKDREAAVIRLRQIGSELTSVSKKVEDASTSKLYVRWAADSKLAIDAIQDVKRESAAATRAQVANDKALSKSRQDALDSEKARSQQHARLLREAARIQREGGTVAEVRDLAAGYKKLSGAYEFGSREAREFANESERLRISIRSAGGEADRSASVYERLSKSLTKSHGSAAGFDNQLRGIGILAAVASIDQLISAAIALGGELVSLAGSAAMAGGALGGILAAGAAQALPVIGLLAGAFQRVNAVMDAVNASQLLQKAQFTDAEKGSQKAIDKANTLANANDAVAEANDRLADSRKALTEAQKEGTDQLQDLILAEKQAALAAKGAALDVKSAQEALRLAVREGASQLEIDQKRQALDEAKLGRTRANVGARRATTERRAAGGDVNNLESVKSAAKAVEDAEKAVGKANRGLDQAADKADRAAGSTMTAAANLNFLLSQLSPAERRLYEAGTHLYESYKKIFQGEGTGGSGIYGVIIDAFTRAVEQVEKIMEMPKVISSVQGLANVIGTNIDKIVGAVADPTVLNQLIGIIDAAGENLGPLVDMAIDLGKAFLNIAETANPAFQDLIKYVGPVVDKFLGLTSDKGKMEDFFSSGEEHLESWLDLVLAIIGLFAALVGASADSGKTSIDDLTERIKTYTDWIDDHHDQVVAFFEDARKAAYKIGGVLENLAVTLGKSFSAERVENFANVLNDLVIPALGDFINFVGWATDKVSDLLKNPVIAQLAKWAIAFFLATKLAGPITSTLAGAASSLLKVGEGLYKFGRGAFVAVKWLAALGTHLETAFIWLMRMRPLFMAAFTGPVAIIAAVVIGIALLLQHFGKLDDIWNAIKETAKQFLEDIQPALDSLSDALGDMGIKVESLQDVMKILEKVGSALAEFISSQLIDVIKGIGKVLAGVVIIIIRTLTGVIKIIKGLADIVIGIVKVILSIFNGSDGEAARKQVLDGFENLVGGIITILGGIVEGLIKVLDGIVKIFLSPFKAGWKAIKDFLGISSPSKKFTQLGRDIIEGLKDGLVGLGKWLIAPWKRAWTAINNFFDGRPKKLAEKIIDQLVEGVKLYVNTWKKIASWLWGRFKDAFDAAKHFGGTIVNAIIEGVKTLPGALLKAIADIGGQLLDVGKAIGGKIVDGIKSAFSAAKGFIGDLVPGGGDDDKKPGPKPAARQTAAPAVKFDLGAAVVPFGAKDLKDAENIYGKFWQELRRDARTSTDYIQRQFREMRIATTNSSDKMYKDIRASLRDIQNSFQVRGGNIGETWAESWQSISRVAYNGLNYIAHETNKALKGMGEKTINFGLTLPKADKGKAGGGFIGQQGQRGRDKGLYALGAGEAVLNWAHQRVVEPAMNAFYGFGLGEMFGHTRAHHAGGPGQGFASGGIVPIPGQPGEKIYSGILPDVMKLIKQYKLTIYDGLGGSPPHAANSDHKWGGAIDAGPGPGGSWDLVDKLAAWAEPHQNNPRSPFRWVGYNGDPNHGRGNHLHLSWIKGKTLGAVGDLVTSVLRPLVTGNDGGLKSIVQAALDKTRKVANKFLDDKMSVPTVEGNEGKKYPKGVLSQGQVESTIKSALNILDITTSVGLWVKALTRQASRESGFNPNAINNWDINAQRGDPSKGLIQTIGATFARFKFKGHNNIFNPLDNVLAAIQYIIATYGGGNADRGAQVIWGRGGGAYAKGGIVDGPDGAPTPILAHAGEWVLNKGQQIRAAMLTGMSPSGLRDALGFSGGPTSFAGGGEVKGRTVKGTVKRLEDILDLSGQLDSLGKSMDNVGLVIRGINRLGPKIQGIAGIVDLATKEGGFLDNLRGAIERRFAAANLKLRRQQLTVRAGRVVRRAQDEVEAADAALGQRRKERGTLTRERGEIQAEFDAVEKRRKKAKKGSTLAKDLASQQILLQTRLDESNERVVQNTEDIFSAQEELARAQEEAAQKRKDAFQKSIDDVKDAFTKRGASLDLAKRVASALGSPELLEKATNTLESNLRDNINSLQSKLADAKSKGYTDIADALQADIDELNTQVVELAQQRLRDAMEAIGTAASRSNAVNDLFGRMADAMGAVGQGVAATIGDVGGVAGLGSRSRAQVAQSRIDTSIQERAGYIGLLGQAQAQGNVGLAQELTDKINELTVAIVEQTKSARDARFAATADAFDYSTSINDLNKQLVEATDAVSGQTSSAELLRLAQERQTLLTTRTDEIQKQLDEAIAAGDTKAAQDLTKELLQNKIAVQGNTKAITDLTNEGTAPSSYQSTPWQWFNIALLNGTGSLLPQYEVPGAMNSGNNLGLGGDTMTSTTSNNGGKTINTTVEINEAGQPIDVTKVASAVVYAQSTAQ